MCGAVIVGQAKDALSFCESLLQNQCKQSEVKTKTHALVETPVLQQI